jgi:hypothetical protein
MAKIIKTDGTIIETHDKPRNLKELQAIVGGLIQFVYLDDDMLLVVNEEGVYRCPPNPTVSEMVNYPIFGDVIIGPQCIGGD